MSHGDRGTAAHRKVYRDPHARARVRTEAAGLAWLRSAAGAPVAEVLSTSDHELVLAQLPPASPGPTEAFRFGRELAATHLAGAESFGALPPGSEPVDGQVWIGEAPLPIGTADRWGAFYADYRVLPYVTQLRHEGRLTSAETALFQQVADRLRSEDPMVCGPAEPPARIHGDLWSGNIVWSRGPLPAAQAHGPDSPPVCGWLIDPCAHGGHRETDLAMLSLFGLTQLDRVIDGYESRVQLSPGWQERLPVHQLHPLLVHAVLFGDHYLRQALSAARSLGRSPIRPG